MDYVMLGIACLIVGWMLGRYGAELLHGKTLVVTISHLEGTDRIRLNGKLGNDDLTGKWQRIPHPQADTLNANS